MFKNYHIVVFKDREGGFRNLRLRGWIGIVLLLIAGGLGGFSYYLWGYYAKSQALEVELEETRRAIRAQDTQVLSLMGKLQQLESDIQRVQKFDSKLRVLMNADKDQAAIQPDMDAEAHASGAMSNPLFLSRHRELFFLRLHSLVDDLNANTRVEEVSQQSLAELLRTNKDTLLSTPSIWPTKGYLTSGFGPRRAPLAGASRVHQGLDIANAIGTPIIAPARGTVTFSQPDGAYGLSIMIDHGNGVVTRYAHMSKLLKNAGEFIQRGDVIGAIGNTGRSTGPHLHYEVHVHGTKVDPMRYILN